MYHARLLVSMSLAMALVGCANWFPPAPADKAMDKDVMMEDKDDAMMKKDEPAMDKETMMEEDAIMKDDDSMMKKDESMMKDESDAMMKNDQVSKGVYTSYTPSVLSNGSQKVLFFHAAWCPACRAADTTLTSFYASMSPSLSVYKVDYDAETALKSRYGVTYQHTFVLVDGEGNAITTIQGPTNAQLKDLIGL